MDITLPAALSSVVVTLAPAVLIALLRIVDVTLNVFRTVFTVGGRKHLAALFHGLEALAWMSAAGIALADMTPVKMGGYVAGVMVGTWVGMQIIERMRLGMVTVRVFAGTDEDPTLGHGILHAIHDAGFGATLFDGTGYRGPVEMVLSTVRRRDADEVVGIVHGVRGDVFVALDNEPLRYPSPVRV
jgi:uncharacterized protein YebE (UPF0316 family)